ncbi:aldehyde-activating protein [Labrys miyagiensis]
MTTRNDKALRATGGCLCGSVRYAIRGALRDVWACHCALCRRVHTYAGAYAACDPADLHMESDSKLSWYRSSPAARRGFCSECGSHLFWEGTAKGHVSVSAGSLDEPTGLRLVKHICTAEKGDFYEITDGLPQE